MPLLGMVSGRRCPHRPGNGLGTATRTSPPRSVRGSREKHPRFRIRASLRTSAVPRVRQGWTDPEKLGLRGNDRSAKPVERQGRMASRTTRGIPVRTGICGAVERWMDVLDRLFRRRLLAGWVSLTLSLGVLAQQPAPPRNLSSRSRIWSPMDTRGVRRLPSGFRELSPRSSATAVSLCSRGLLASACWEGLQKGCNQDLRWRSEGPFPCSSCFPW